MAGEQDLDTDTIRREVERLAPWYYDFDLAGVRTSETPASDPTGHRTIRFPKVRGGFWAGRDVLDVACAEGAWTFGALDLGARVTSFDVREAHLEKARFVAKVRGYTEVEFGLGDCDTWPDQHPDRRFDHVTLCGIIYHVPDPPKTVERYCQVARRSVLVTSPTWGVDDTGYTWWEEDDVIGASRDYLPSQIPNSAWSLVNDFQRHGFYPSHLEETGHGQFGAGVGALFERAVFRDPNQPWSFEPDGGGKGYDLFAFGSADGLHVCACPRRFEPMELAVQVRIVGADGAVLREAEEQIPLRARHRYGNQGTVGSCDFMLEREHLPGFASAERFGMELRLTAPDGAVHEARYDLARMG